ncbi:MAG: hypothetical protein DRI57_18850 [Deltaproteobacteria bacterium]|nr:MAG: hypothetical protein DRI57_18850 [Deltaproteobacteria bacterium]
MQALKRCFIIFLPAKALLQHFEASKQIFGSKNNLKKIIPKIMVEIAIVNCRIFHTDFLSTVQ